MVEQLGKEGLLVSYAKPEVCRTSSLHILHFLLASRFIGNSIVIASNNSIKCNINFEYSLRYTGITILPAFIVITSTGLQHLCRAKNSLNFGCEYICLKHASFV